MSGMYEPARTIAHTVIDYASSAMATAEMDVDHRPALEHACEAFMGAMGEDGSLDAAAFVVSNASILWHLVLRLEAHGEDRQAVFDELRATINGT